MLRRLVQPHRLRPRGIDTDSLTAALTALTCICVAPTAASHLTLAMIAAQQQHNANPIIPASASATQYSVRPPRWRALACIFSSTLHTALSTITFLIAARSRTTHALNPTQ